MNDARNLAFWLVYMAIFYVAIWILEAALAVPDIQ